MLESSQKKIKSPKISVIIPFYNRAEFLAEAVESVLAQSYENWELILIDDGSNDGSTQIAEDFASAYPHKIFVYRHEAGKNRGASASRSLGIRHSNGDLITFLDSDDIFQPRTLALETAAFAEHPEAEAVCGTLEYWFSWNAASPKKEREFIVNLGVQTDAVYSPPSLLVHNLRAGGRKPGIGCVILKSEFAKKHRLFEDDFRYVSEDQLFWAKVCLSGNIFVTGNCFAKYRQHEKSSSSVLLESGKAAEDWGKFLDWLEKYLGENDIQDQDVLAALKLCRRENDYKAKYQFLLDIYRRIFPFYLRYRIRDLIVRFRQRS